MSRTVYVIVSGCWGDDDLPMVAFADRHRAIEHLARLEAEKGTSPGAPAPVY